MAQPSVMRFCYRALTTPWMRWEVPVTSRRLTYVQVISRSLWLLMIARKRPSLPGMAIISSLRCRLAAAMALAIFNG